MTRRRLREVVDANMMTRESLARCLRAQQCENKMRDFDARGALSLRQFGGLMAAGQ